MSDGPQGPGWWLASDGKWYPPQPAPADQPTVPDEPAPTDPTIALADDGAAAAGERPPYGQPTGPPVGPAHRVPTGRADLPPAGGRTGRSARPGPPGHRASLGTGRRSQPRPAAAAARSRWSSASSCSCVLLIGGAGVRAHPLEGRRRGRPGRHHARRRRRRPPPSRTSDHQEVDHDRPRTTATTTTAQDHHHDVDQDHHPDDHDQHAVGRGVDAAFDAATAVAGCPTRPPPSARSSAKQICTAIDATSVTRVPRRPGRQRARRHGQRRTPASSSASRSRPSAPSTSRRPRTWPNSQLTPAPASGLRVASEPWCVVDDVVLRRRASTVRRRGGGTDDDVGSFTVELVDDGRPRAASPTEPAAANSGQRPRCPAGAGSPASGPPGGGVERAALQAVGRLGHEGAEDGRGEGARRPPGVPWTLSMYLVSAPG